MLGIGVWLGLVCAGMLGLAHYANRPGKAAHALVTWPPDSALLKDQQLPTLVLIAHPQCACTRASLDELEKLLTHRAGQLKTFVLFYQPLGQTEEWVKASLWQQAARLPGVQVWLDVEGRETRRFGAETSGQTFLYTPQGQLVFQGGITAARGHAGDNYGSQAIATFLDTGHPTLQQTPIFGCALWNEPATTQENHPAFHDAELPRHRF